MRQLHESIRKTRKRNNTTARLKQTHTQASWHRDRHCQVEFPDLLPLSSEPISGIRCQLLVNNMLGEFSLYSGCHLAGCLSHVHPLPAILCSFLPHGRSHPLAGFPCASSTLPNVLSQHPVCFHHSSKHNPQPFHQSSVFLGFGCLPG